ncbi:hypothetical protein Taro_012919 [Colocasia esculenta]|uniref:Uncharacterized protein n=1 Tax=Colocasia esculenta TaxID=4460 RepID=A0A843UEY6_COLES|nr:hypothetical protein [Colocasia esculenta]
MMTRGTPRRDTSSCNHDKGHLTGTPRHVMMTRGTHRKDASSCNHDKGHLVMSTLVDRQVDSTRLPSKLQKKRSQTGRLQLLDRSTLKDRPASF